MHLGKNIEKIMVLMFSLGYLDHLVALDRVISPTDPDGFQITKNLLLVTLALNFILRVEVYFQKLQLFL